MRQHILDLTHFFEFKIVFAGFVNLILGIKLDALSVVVGCQAWSAVLGEWHRTDLAELSVNVIRADVAEIKIVQPVEHDERVNDEFYRMICFMKANKNVSLHQ